jgi:ketosteroid isomerase-like protein
MVRLNVPIPKGTSATGDPSLDVYKSFLESEGEIPTGKSPQEKSAPPQNVPRQKGEPQSWVPGLREWLTVNAAWADESSAQGGLAEEEVRRVLEKYRQAYEQKDPELLATVYQTFTPAQQEANTKYFQNTQGLRVTISDVDIAVRGDEAAVSYTREDEFIDAKTKQKVKLDVRFTKIFVRTEDGWKMVVGKR